MRLHFNENTAGCSPAVLSALAAMRAEDFSTYPDYGAITATCERYFGVPDGWVQLTNGLDEGLHLAAQWAAREPDAAVIVPQPAFEMYEISAAGAGARVVRIPPEPDFRFQTAAILDAIGPATRLVYLCDPNNPTGLPIPAGAIEHIAGQAPSTIVLVDEAYTDFSGRSLIGPALDRHRNLVIGRTFAKAHGLAALRAGALVAHPDTLARFRALQPPYSLNICAAVALAAAIDDTAYRDWYVAQAHESRRLLYEFAEQRGWTVWPSEGNFVLIRIGDAAPAIVAALAERGIHIRDKSAAPGCAGCVRITAGVVEHTRACIAALDELRLT